MTTAFVLGNGVSRQQVELEPLRSYGKIYGCNALYRDFTPDVLVATDPGISGEIQNSGYAQKNVFYTRNPIKGLGAKRIEHNFGYSSGPIALSYASHDGATTIYILGFDFSGINGLFNNVYADTAHYKHKNEAETYYGNWVDQVCKIVTVNSHRQYIRVVPPNGLIPQSLAQLSNLQHQLLEQFVANHK